MTKSVVLGLCLALSTAVAVGQTAPIGLLSKVINEVSRKDENAEWAKASKGDLVATGNRIRTGVKSFALIKFNDNTMVRVREESEVTLAGTHAAGAFSKSVDLTNGAVGFKVQRQRSGEEFRFTSPTSVASVRGTEGFFATSAAGDTLTIIIGLVGLRNLSSQTSVDVGEGFTGISNPDGSVTSREATREERRKAMDALRTGDRPRQLKLQLKTPDGEKQELIIDFKE
jgi:hypothetical protein